MLNSDNASDLLARAEMHEQLGETTEDPPARKMHLAMAAEFRRRAAERGAVKIVSRPTGSRVEFTAAAL